MRYSDIRNCLNIIESAFQRYTDIYVFGAGMFANSLIKWLKISKLIPRGVVVTNTKEQYFNGISINIINDVGKNRGGIILAVSSKYHSEIIDRIKESFDEVFILPDDFFRVLSFMQTLEIRTGDRWGECDNFISFYEVFSKKKTIILKRIAGMGDALIAEPVCRKLKEMGFKVGILTKYKEVFYNSTSVDFISSTSTNVCIEGFVYVSLAYGYHPFYHILNAYIDNIKQFIPRFMINGEERIPIYDKKLIKPHNDEGKNICMNIEASGWKSRIFDHEKMKKVSLYLIKKGYNIFEIGSEKKNYLGVGRDCFDLSLRETVELMSKSDLYIGMDNGLMHIAQAIRLPVFVMFGSVCPLYRIHDWSRARVMWKNVDELSCAGCFHRRELPCGEPSCIHEECKCLEWSVEEVIYAFENLKYNNPPVLKDEMLTPLWQIDEE